MSMDETYWSLSQAAAWVVFRDRRVVDLFAPPEPQSWSTFMAYRKTTPATAAADRGGYFAALKEHGKFPELFGALQSGQLTASGLRAEPDGLMQEIPSIDWKVLIGDPEGPYLRLPTDGRSEPWREIIVRCADVERLWRRPSEIADRSQFDKEWIKVRFGELKELHSNFSDNRIIDELQLEFQEQTGKEPPSRSTIQRYIKSP